jgi:carboxymethylenebutenolidase
MTDDERVRRAAALLERCGVAREGLGGDDLVARADAIAAAAAEYDAARGADLAAMFDEHVADEFVARDVDATMATMTESPYLDHVPVMTGGVGRAEVRRFYAEHFIGRWPQDTSITPVARTVGPDRVVEEMVMSFTHDVEMDAIVPGVAPTGRRVELPFVVVMGFEGGKVSYEHIYWDQAAMLVQLGLLDPEGLPVTGAEQARKLLDPSLPSNRLMPHPRT